MLRQVGSGEGEQGIREAEKERLHSPSTFAPKVSAAPAVMPDAWRGSCLTRSGWRLTRGPVLLRSVSHGIGTVLRISVSSFCPPRSLSGAKEAASFVDECSDCSAGRVGAKARRPAVAS